MHYSLYCRQGEPCQRNCTGKRSVLGNSKNLKQPGFAWIALEEDYSSWPILLFQIKSTTEKKERALFNAMCCLETRDWCIAKGALSSNGRLEEPEYAQKLDCKTHQTPQSGEFTSGGTFHLRWDTQEGPPNIIKLQRRLYP